MKSGADQHPPEVVIQDVEGLIDRLCIGRVDSLWIETQVCAGEWEVREVRYR